jgi:beta-lactam-binding protein with PASTA domain
VPSDQPEGTVVAQNPTGGQLRQGETVRINVSQGPSTTTTTTTTPTTTQTTPTDTTTP